MFGKILAVFVAVIILSITIFSTHGSAMLDSNYFPFSSFDKAKDVGG